MKYVISSLEIASIVYMRHKNFLRKIEGSKRVKGITEYLQDYGYLQEDYLKKTVYQDKQNKTRPCYEFTQLGWQFAINLFTGDRGNLLTHEYVKRYGNIGESKEDIRNRN